MIFEVQENDGGMFATLHGRLDTPSAVVAEQETTPLLENANKEIILDCSNLEYISSSGLRLLLTIRKDTIAKGGQVIIERISDAIKKVFMMKGFRNHFETR